MQLDAFDSIGEPPNCWQRAVTETSMPDNDIFLVYFLPNARVYLSILDRIQCIENHSGRCGKGGSENKLTVDQWRLVDKY